MKLVPGCKGECSAEKYIHSKGSIEHWWNLSIKTAIKTKNNVLNLISGTVKQKLVKC